MAETQAPAEQSPGMLMNDNLNKPSILMRRHDGISRQTRSQFETLRLEYVPPLCHVSRTVPNLNFLMRISKTH